MKAKIGLSGIALTPSQHRANSMVECFTRFIDTHVWKGGSRSGKTFFAALFTIKHCFMFPGCEILFTAQTRGQIGRTLEKAFLKVCKIVGVKPVFKSDLKGGGDRYELNSCKIYLHPYEGAGVDRIIGSEYGLIVMDEAFRCTLEKYGMLHTRLSGDGLCHLIMLTNPQGKIHLIHKVIEKMDTTVTYNFDTRENADNLDNPNYIKTLEKLPAYLRKRYLEGIEEDAIGAVYNNFDPARNISAGIPDKTGIRYSIGGIDFGGTAPFAYAHMLILENGQVYIRHAYEQAQTALKLHAAMIKRINEKYPNTQIWSDHGRQERIELDNYGIFPEPAPKADKLYSLSVIREMIESGQLIIDEFCEKAMVAITNYYWEENKEDKPVKEDDHIHDAIMYGIMGAYDSGFFNLWGDGDILVHSGVTGSITGSRSKKNFWR